MKSIQFRLLGFPIIIHPMAWLVLGFILLSEASGGPLALLGGAVWAVVLFGSILIHELGHALVARGFQLGPVQIELLGFLGFARYRRRPTPGRAVLVTAAGPGASLILGGVSLALLLGLELTGLAAGASLSDPFGLLHELLLDSAYVNIVFGLFNLLPMRPLDGGSLLDSGLVLMGMAPAKVDRLVAVVSIVLAVGLGLLALVIHWWFLIFVAFWVISRNLASLGIGPRRA
jgi:Zn-dependent protease